MGTVIRPEITKKSKYWVEKHRYYELKHFCLQYPQWKRSYSELDGYAAKSTSIVNESTNTAISDPTVQLAEARLYFAERMQMVERAAEEASPEYGRYILKAVTEGLSYESIKARDRVPCCKEVYYDVYRRFFWLLSRARN